MKIAHIFQIELLIMNLTGKVFIIFMSMALGDISCVYFDLTHNGYIQECVFYFDLNLMGHTSLPIFLLTGDVETIIAEATDLLRDSTTLKVSYIDNSKNAINQSTNVSLVHVGGISFRNFA